MMAEQRPDSGGSPLTRGALAVPGQHVLTESNGRPNWADLDGDQVRRRTGSGTSFSVLLHGLRRHWVLGLVLAMLMSACSAAAAWLWFTPEFGAFALLRVYNREPKLVFTTTENDKQDFEIYKRTQKGLMSSRFVLSAALRSPDVERLPAVREEEDAVAWLEKRLYVEFPGEAELMKVSFSHADANTAATITNAVTRAYMREVVDVERRQRMDRLTSLEKVLNDAEQKMRTKQTDLKRLADSLGTGDGNALSSKQQITLQHFATLRNEHTRIQFELMRSKLNLTTLEEESGGTFDAQTGMDEETVDSYVDQAPELISQKHRIDEMHRVIEHNEGVMSNGKHPRLVKQRNALAQAEEEYNKARAVIKSHVRKEIARGTYKSNNPMATLKHNVAVLEAQDKKMSEDVEKFAKEAESIGRSSIDVEMMRSELKQIEDLSTHLGKEIDSLRVELRSPSRVIELQAADVPRHAGYDRPYSHDQHCRLAGLPAAVPGGLHVGCPGTAGQHGLRDRRRPGHADRRRAAGTSGPSA